MSAIGPRFLPRTSKSGSRPACRKTCRSGHKRMASCTECASQFLRWRWQLNAIVPHRKWHPVIGQIEGIGRDRILPPSRDRNQLNTLQPIPALQLSSIYSTIVEPVFARTPELARRPYSSRGRSKAMQVAMTASPFSISTFPPVPEGCRSLDPARQIFKIVSNEWLGRQLIDCCIVLGVKQHRTIGFMWAIGGTPLRNS